MSIDHRGGELLPDFSAEVLLSQAALPGGPGLSGLVDASADGDGVRWILWVPALSGVYGPVSVMGS